MLAKEKYGIRGREMHELPHAQFVPFTAQTRMSGVDIERHAVSARARPDSVAKFVGGNAARAKSSAAVEQISGRAARRWSSRRNDKALGVIHLKDIVKGGLAGALQALPRDGHQDGDDHRRQPADRRRHRHGGGRG